MIDDNQALVEMVKEYFSNHKQIEVSLCCKDGEEGLKTIINESDKYDIILLYCALNTYKNWLNFLKFFWFVSVSGFFKYVLRDSLEYTVYVLLG